MCRRIMGNNEWTLGLMPDPKPLLLGANKYVLAYKNTKFKDEQIPRITRHPRKARTSKGTKYSIWTCSLLPIIAFYDMMWSVHHFSSWIWSLWHRQSHIKLIFPQARANSNSSLAVFPAMGHPDLIWEVRRRERNTKSVFFFQTLFDGNHFIFYNYSEI